MIDFFENIGWDIGSPEKALIKSADYICKYRNKHGGLSGEFTQNLEKVINFFYEPEPEPMPFGIFWDDGEEDYIQVGYMEINIKYPDDSNFKYIRHPKATIVIHWKNFKEIKTIEELKEYYK